MFLKAQLQTDTLIRTFLRLLYLVNGIPQILLKPFGLWVDAHLTVAVLQLGNDLEGAVGRVEEFDLADAALRNGVQRGTAPATLHQTDGLSVGGWRVHSHCQQDNRRQDLDIHDERLCLCERDRVFVSH